MPRREARWEICEDCGTPTRPGLMRRGVCLSCREVRRRLREMRDDRLPREPSLPIEDAQRDPYR